MNLHEDTDGFLAAIEKTSESLKIREIFVEKDYWITYVLKRLSDSDFRDDVVFKGGTSLAKAFDIVKRFSEDIDLALCNREDLTRNGIKTRVQNIKKN